MLKDTQVRCSLSASQSDTTLVVDAEFCENKSTTANITSSFIVVPSCGVTVVEAISC